GNESRTNRGRIADSIDFGLRSHDISSARSKLPQDEVARKPFAGFSRLKSLTPRPITPRSRSQGCNDTIPEENVTGSAPRSGVRRAGGSSRIDPPGGSPCRLRWEAKSGTVQGNGCRR